MRRILLVITLICIAIIPQIAHSQTCDETQGTVTRETYSSSLLGQQMFYTVYAPPCYGTTSQIYPVAYLMHGSNDDDNHWIRLGVAEYMDKAITQGDIEPMVLVFPFGNVIANRNRFDTISWRNIFLDELMPHVESAYRISQNREMRAIGGISRGGFWAYQIALSEPDLFSAIGGHSAFFDSYHAEPKDNPLDLALSLNQISDVALWLDRGKDDFAAPGLDLMHERLNSINVTHEYTIYPEGQHNNGYWSQHIDEYVTFYSEALSSQERITATSVPSLFVTNTPSAPIAIATPTQTTESQAQVGKITYYPAIAFPSLETSLSSDVMTDIAAGQRDTNLVLPQTTATAFLNAGIALHTDTNIVPDVEIFTVLWRDRTKYSFLPLDLFDIRLRVLWVDDQPVETMADYPFRLATNEENSTARITLSGVTALTRNTRTAIETNSIEWAASGIQSYVLQTDIFHISNEVSAVATCPNSNADLLGGSNSFCMLPAYTDLFRLLDADVIELTGNHNNDYGYQAYEDTLTLYDELGVKLIGGGSTIEEARSPFVTTISGNTIAMLACNAAGPYYALANDDPNLLGGIRPGAAACDWAWLETEIPRLATEVDVLIVTVQYPEVEEYLPLAQQQIDFRRIADLGADVVMGTQAHKPQTYEFYNTGSSTALIHYGMGNLFFDQPFWGNMRFFMNTLYIHDGELKAIEIYPGIIDDLARPRLMTPEERINFLHYMFIQQNGF